jgi:dCMP deaminase
MAGRERPSWDDYYINIAWVVASRSSCLRRRVGALIVVEKRIVSTGYNGTPFGVKNCDEGGCPRCASNAPSGAGLEYCLCVHGEQNAIALAARQGTATETASLYATTRPCFNCLKESVQAGIREVVFDQPYDYDDDLEDAYQSLLAQSGLVMRRHAYRDTHAVPLTAWPSGGDIGPESPGGG